MTDWARESRRLKTALALGRLIPTYFAFGALKHILPLGVLARLASRHPRLDGECDRERVIARVHRATKLVGVPERDCLQRSLLLYRELCRAGARPTLMVGVARGENAARGHAWVVAEGRVIGEDAEHVAQFEWLCSFGPTGQMIAAPFANQVP